MSPDIFKFDPNYIENEERYKAIKVEILGEGSSDEEGSEESDDEDEEEEEGLFSAYPTNFRSPVFAAVEDKEGIEDRTAMNLTNLRRTIYLTIMNALNYEEAVHKLLKVQLREGEEVRTLHVENDSRAHSCCSLSSARWS